MDVFMVGSLMMNKEDIKLFDFQRIFIGDAPPVFLLEVFLRTLVAYVALMFLLRILGKRMNGNATVSEMAVILTLGAIVSVPMQSPDKGILIGLLGLICAFIFYRGLNWLSFRNAKIEHWVQGQMHILVKDGTMQVKALKKCDISAQQVLAVLRSNGIDNLGEVKRLYIEACGTFSIYKFDKQQWGLATMPPLDQNILKMYQVEGEARACTYCGFVEGKSDVNACTHCGESKWTQAIHKP